MMGRRLTKDPTLWAIPGYFAAMAIERRWYRNHPESKSSPGAYESRDTRTSLTMGNLSVLAPMVLPPLLAPLMARRGRLAKVVLAVGADSALATAAADRYLERRSSEPAGEAAAQASAAEAEPFTVEVEGAKRTIVPPALTPAATADADDDI